MFHVAEVDYTTPAGAKEGGVVQPALAVSEGAPNEKPVIEEMHERMIKARFKKRNVLDPYTIQHFIPSVSRTKSLL